MMTTETNGRARFAELVKLQTQGRRFIDSDQERKILEDGVVRYGLSLDEAVGLLRSATDGGSVSLEGEVGVSARQLLKTLADRRNRVARADFDRAVAFYKARAAGGVSNADAQRRVKRLMEELDLQPKATGRIIRSRRWYRMIEA
jgi:hypothetical protein